MIAMHLRYFQAQLKLQLLAEAVMIVAEKSERHYGKPKQTTLEPVDRKTQWQR
jgi:hypothetical protein